MTAHLDADALLMAVTRRGKPGALKRHSDRGAQYASEQFQRLTADSGSVRKTYRISNEAREMYSTTSRGSISHPVSLDGRIPQPC
jgi:transposase InsO family protein